jgi:pimeloyl-ACP methyl ester carboxylesterase
MTHDVSRQRRGDDVPRLSIRRPSGQVRAVALVLHGGAERGTRRVHPFRLAYLRMVPFVRAIHAAGRSHGVEVWLLRNRLRGWNAPALDPVRDARWTLEKLRQEHPDVPVLIVGHSMGGRVALRVADDPAVTGVCALAPWTPPGEPVEPVRGKSVVIAHGTGDRMTDPAASFAYAVRAQPLAARLARFELRDERHAMLRRPAVWNRLVQAFALDVLGITAEDPLLEAAWTNPPADRLRISL